MTRNAITVQMLLEICTREAKDTKGIFKLISRKQTENAMAKKRKTTTRQTTVYKT